MVVSNAKALTLKRTVLALIVGLVFFAESDILIWQRIFEKNLLWQFDSQYQSGHLVVLWGMIFLGVIFLIDKKVWALWFATAFYTLVYGGVEDILYYWLDGQSLPNQLPWLESYHPLLLHPVTSFSLVFSAALWIGFWVLSLVILAKLKLFTVTKKEGK